MKIKYSNLYVFLLYILYFQTCLAFGSIYKTENANGALIFTDQPSEAAKKINLKPANIYSEKIDTKSDDQNSTKNNQDQKNSNIYKKLIIQHPVNQQKFNNEEKITAQILIQPHLKKEHFLFLSLDEKTYEINNDLNVEIFRGEHTIYAWIADEQQKKLANTEKITFFNGKTAILHIVK